MPRTLAILLQKFSVTLLHEASYVPSGQLHCSQQETIPFKHSLCDAAYIIFFDVNLLCIHAYGFKAHYTTKIILHKAKNYLSLYLAKHSHYWKHVSINALNKTAILMLCKIFFWEKSSATIFSTIVNFHHNNALLKIMNWNQRKHKYT